MQLIDGTAEQLRPIGFETGLSVAISSAGTQITRGAERHVGEHQTIYYEGDLTEYFHEIVSGSVKLYRLLPDGRRVILGFAFPGDIIGLAFGGEHEATAEALCDSVIRSISKARLESQMAENAELLRAVLGSVSRNLSAAHDHLISLGRKKTQERVASFLVNLASRQGIEKGSSCPIHIAMYRSDIADFLGLTVETVCRTLTKLKNCNIIRVEQTKDIHVINWDRLLDLADGDDSVPGLCAA